MGFWERDHEWDWKKTAIWAAVLLLALGVLALLIVAFAVASPPKATADDALLQRFTLSSTPSSPTPNSTISYNATVAVSLYNPNIHRAISYGAMAAAFSFNGTRFDDQATVPAFEQGARKTTTVRVTVGGADRAVRLSAAGVAEFGREKGDGRFMVEVRMESVMRYKGRKTDCPVVVVCPLLLQLVDPAVAATAFQKTKCTILRAKKSGC